MTSGLFASFTNNQMQSGGANTVHLIGDVIAAVLYPFANSPSQAQLDGAITTIADLDAATGGSIGDVATHFVALVSKSLGLVGPRIWSAGDTQWTAPAAGVASGTLFIRMDGAQPDPTDVVISFFDPSSPPTPNGVDPIPLKFPNGIIKYGE